MILHRYTESTLTDPGWYWYLKTGVNPEQFIRIVFSGKKLVMRYPSGMQVVPWRGTYIGPIDIEEIERTK